MPSYETAGYDPPAPVAILSLRSSAGHAVATNVRMLLDRGADITLLPRAAVARVGVAPQSGIQYELLGLDGTRRLADAVDMDMLLLSRWFRGRYLLTDDADGLIGRDVLASLALLLDRPKQAWTEQK